MYVSMCVCTCILLFPVNYPWNILIFSVDREDSTLLKGKFSLVIAWEYYVDDWNIPFSLEAMK